MAEWRPAPREATHAGSQRIQEHLAFLQEFGQRFVAILSPAEVAPATPAPVGTGTTASAELPPTSALCPECGMRTSQVECERCGTAMVEALEAWRMAGVEPPVASTSSSESRASPTARRPSPAAGAVPIPTVDADDWVRANIVSLSFE